MLTQDLKYKDVALPDPESQPYPWVGRADRDLIKWQEIARNFQRRQREKAIMYHTLFLSLSLSLSPHTHTVGATPLAQTCSVVLDICSVVP